jgi:hypothetical protein
MNSPARLSPRNTRAPPLRIKRRQSPLDDAHVLFDRRVFLVLLCIRVFNSLTVQTFFQPDEYYQSLEPAWKLVYGYGETTWEWKEAIRGFLYPSFFASLWWALKTLGVKDANFLVFYCLSFLMVDCGTQNPSRSFRCAVRLLDLPSCETALQP